MMVKNSVRHHWVVFRRRSCGLPMDPVLMTPAGADGLERRHRSAVTTAIGVP